MTTTFLNGPANGVHLSIRRAPLFLRVVHDTTYAAAICKKDRQEWDCLDQLKDTPRVGETIYVYRLVEKRGTVHIRACKPGHGGLMVMATYTYHETQPSEVVTRNANGWQQWCQAEYDRMVDEERQGPQ